MSRSYLQNKWMKQKTCHFRYIQAQLKTDQGSVGWLSRQISCSRNHVYKLFKRPSLDSELLLRISTVKQFNFFQYYTAEFLQSMKERMGEKDG